MNSTIKKIIIPLIFIVMLPAITYSVYEITSLNDTEIVIEDIYKKQLNTILNSVNQYSDMVITSWANSISVSLDAGASKTLQADKADFQKLLETNKSIIQMVLAENSDLASPLIVKNKPGTDLETLKNIADENKDKVERLFGYIGKGYRKIEPLQNDAISNQIFAVVIAFENENILGLIEIDPSLFVDDVLRPIILEAAGSEFAIAIYSDDNLHLFNYDKEFDKAELNVTSSFWLLPDYEMGIVLKGRTLGGLVAERTYTNLILLLILNIIIVGGVLIIYRNIKKEIELAQIKSDFVSNVSHELRTPLALISMYSETLEMGRVKTNEKREEYYKIISQESNRLSRIVNSILNFSKIEAGKRKYNLAPGSINDVVRNVYETYNYHLTSRGFQFDISCHENLPQIEIDREAVSEAVINLLDNSAKYSKDEKVISLKTRMNDKFVYVEIEDRGIGISKEDQEKIFDKFFRVSTGLVHDTKGTGLGLTIVKHVMDAHNAEIEIKSKVGKGSTFRVLFPKDKK